MPDQPIKVADVIDNAKVGPLQVGLFVLCAMCLILDGFDVQVVGYVAPTIFQEWQVPRSALGNVLAAGNFGVLVGSLVFTMVADKIGRRPVLIGATIFFSALTLLTSRVTTVAELTLIRFVAGIGLGCIIPNATALIGEYSPARLRVAFMACISVGFTAGARRGRLRVRVAHSRLRLAIGVLFRWSNAVGHRGVDVFLASRVAAVSGPEAPQPR